MHRVIFYYYPNLHGRICMAELRKQKEKRRNKKGEKMAKPKTAASQYEGMYVAKTGSNGKKVIASGTDPVQVFMEAKKETKEPFICFVPPKNMIHLF